MKTSFLIYEIESRKFNSSINKLFIFLNPNFQKLNCLPLGAKKNFKIYKQKKKKNIGI